MAFPVKEALVPRKGENRLQPYAANGDRGPGELPEIQVLRNQYVAFGRKVAGIQHMSSEGLGQERGDLGGSIGGGAGLVPAGIFVFFDEAAASLDVPRRMLLPKNLAVTPAYRHGPA